MQLRTVDPRTLETDPTNPRRSGVSTEAEAQLQASIAAIGIIQPPVVVERDDRLVIRVGHRRVKAAIAAGLETIEVLVLAEAGDGTMAQLSENSVRAAMVPVDTWKSMERLTAAGWSDEAAAQALALSAREVRRLKLLGRLHPPLLEHIATGDMPAEHYLRIIATAPRSEQAEVWKTRKPKKGERAAWWEIARALQKRRMSARDARFDDAAAKAHGISWEEDLFAPAGEDGRTTTDVEAFLAAQGAWLAANLPENGVILACDEHGHAHLPKGARPVHGAPEPGDVIGHTVIPEDGRIVTCAFRPLEPKATRAGPTTPRVLRPEVTRKGQELIGELRTEALRRALGEAEIGDGQLLGLMVLALAGRNVEVRSVEADDGHGVRQRVAREIAGGGALTGDMAVLRRAARTVLARVLSCRADRSSSGAAAILAGAAVGAERYLPNMATEEFLACLSRQALDAAAAACGLRALGRAKDTRGMLVKHGRKAGYVHPAARFVLSERAVGEDEAVKGSREDESWEGPATDHGAEAQETDGESGNLREQAA